MYAGACKHLVVSRNLLTHDYDLVPLGVFSAADSSFQSLGCIDEVAAVTPHEIDLAKFRQQILPVGLGGQSTIDEIRRLIIEAISHMKIGLRDRVSLVQIDGSFATERVLYRLQLAGIVDVIKYLCRFRFRFRFRCLFRRQYLCRFDRKIRYRRIHRMIHITDRRILFNDDNGLVHCWCLHGSCCRQRVYARFISIKRLPGLRFLIVVVAAATHEPEQQTTNDDDDTGNPHPPARQCAENPIEKTRFGPAWR